MRSFLFLFFTVSFAISPSGLSSQNYKIKIDEDKIVTVDEVFDIIQDQTSHTFVYRADMFANYPSIELKKGIIGLNSLLKKSLSTGDIVIVLTKNNAILLKEKSLTAQKIIVTGTISDNFGLPLVGASIMVKGTTIGTTSDSNGNYSITIPDPDNVIVFSFLGFKTKEISVDSRTIIDVVLEEEFGQLNEVVVNGGYYETTRAESTGNISKVSAQEIQKQPITNAIGTLQGRMAGVEIRQTSGVPGSGFSIKIRGDNSLRGSEPLYIIDGTPINSISGQEFFTNQGILPSGGISPLDGINPADIESIEVLKDADATAIYGSRGANGVVLITTKKGTVGKTVFDINLYSGITDLTRRKNYLNTQEHLEVRWESFANDQAYDLENFGVILTEPTPGEYDVNGVFSETKYTDWQDYLLGNTGRTNNLQMSVSGGSERTQFRIGGGISDEEPTLIGDDNSFKRISVQSSINHRSKNDRFSVGLNTTYVNNEANYPSDDFSFTSENLSPNANELVDEDGNLVYLDAQDVNILTPLFNKFQSVNTNLLASLNVQYEILPKVEIKANLGYNVSNDSQSNTDKASLGNPDGFRGIGSETSQLFLTDGQTSSYNFEPQLTWNPRIGPGGLNVIVGATWNKRESVFNTTIGTNFADDAFINNIGAANVVDVTSTETPYAYSAYFARLGYNIDNKYILNLSGRRDGSSRFGPNNRFSNFGSIGAAWVFSQEKFLMDNTVLTFGKLRASYGRTGSDNIGDFQYLELYQSPFGGYSGVTPTYPRNLANANFSWEGVNKFEVGLSLGFLDSRINFDASYYQNRTTNQLIQQPLPTTTGFSGIQINLPAVIQNKGLELELNTTNIQKENFNWTTSFNITIPKNELLEFPDLESNNSFRNRLVIGESINIIRVYDYNGVDPQTGLYTFTDFNGNGRIDFEGVLDRQEIVNPDPKLFGGLTNNLAYKNFNFGFTFQFVNRTGALQVESAVTRPGALTTDILDRWQQPGDIATTQMLITPFSNNIEALEANFFLGRSNGIYGNERSFIRLQNISFDYTIPKAATKSLTARLYLQAQNLLTFSDYTGWDPDSGSPLFKTFTIGGQFTF